MQMWVCISSITFFIQIRPVSRCFRRAGQKRTITESKKITDTGRRMPLLLSLRKKRGQILKHPLPAPQSKNCTYHPGYHHPPPAEAQGSTKHWNNEQFTSASHPLLLSPKTTWGLPWWLRAQVSFLKGASKEKRFTLQCGMSGQQRQIKAFIYLSSLLRLHKAVLDASLQAQQRSIWVGIRFQSLPHTLPLKLSAGL